MWETLCCLVPSPQLTVMMELILFVTDARESLHGVLLTIIILHVALEYCVGRPNVFLSNGISFISTSVCFSVYA